MPPDSRREQLIAEALRGRLLEVRASLGTVPTAAERAPAAQDPEEQLRIVMVRLWPPARGEGADAIAFERLVEGILPIEQAADSDLRFLDAWNNAYEALAARPGLLAGPAGKRLLDSYAAVLEVRVHRPV